VAGGGGLGAAIVGPRVQGSAGATCAQRFVSVFDAAPGQGRVAPRADSRLTTSQHTERQFYGRGSMRLCPLFPCGLALSRACGANRWIHMRVRTEAWCDNTTPRHTRTPHGQPNSPPPLGFEIGSANVVQPTDAQ